MINELGGAALAYIGDAAAEVWVRRLLLESGIVNPSVCSIEALQFVPARAQSAAYERIRDILTADEAQIFLRGRNAHVTTPKSASPADYHRATGFEAVIGWLYMNGCESRINELLGTAYSDKIDDMKKRHNINTGDEKTK